MAGAATEDRDGETRSRRARWLRDGSITPLTDWPTIVAFAAFWMALAAILFGHEHLPAPVSVVGLALLGGFYMSLQHEVIHGHPTPWPGLNRLLAALPLGMLQPYSRYRDTHRQHHASDLTDPRDDPESYYVSLDAWDGAGRVGRSILLANRTLAFRITVGPVLAAWRVLRVDLRLMPRRVDVVVAWAAHLVGCALVIGAVHTTGASVWVYVVGFVYGGAALTSLRSFVEHRADDHGSRSAIVRSNRFFALLYLNNNLHDTHHRLPGVAWFRLPEMTDALHLERGDVPVAGCYRGYGEIVRTYLFHPFEQPVHPRSDTISA